MTKLGKPLSLTLMLLLLSTSVSNAATIEQKLEACDAALYAKVKEATLCGLGVDLYKEARANDQKEIAELRSKGTAWYSNPFVWGALGAILGVYAGARATR